MEKLEEDKTYTTSEVANLIGYTRQSVHNAIKVLGLDVKLDNKGYHLTAKQANEIAKHFGKGKPFDTGKQTKRNQVLFPSLDVLDKIIESYEKQLDAKDVCIKQQAELISSLIDNISSLSKMNHQLMVGYTAEKTATAAEKTADSVERMNAIAPREDDKLGFAARLKFLFTGRK